MGHWTERWGQEYLLGAREEEVCSHSSIPFHRVSKYRRDFMQEGCSATVYLHRALQKRQKKKKIPLQFFKNEEQLNSREK